MARHPRKRSGARPPVDPVDALRAYAVSLRDKGDGHGTDWPLVAADAFRVAFYCLDQAPAGDERASSVLRRAHDGAYTRMAGSPDSGTPYARPGQAEAFTAASGPNAKPEPTPRH